MDVAVAAAIRMFFFLLCNGYPPFGRESYAYEFEYRSRLMRCISKITVNNVLIKSYADIV